MVNNVTILLHTRGKYRNFTYIICYEIKQVVVTLIVDQIPEKYTPHVKCMNLWMLGKLIKGDADGIRRRDAASAYGKNIKI